MFAQDRNPPPAATDRHVLMVALAASCRTKSGAAVRSSMPSAVMIMFIVVRKTLLVMFPWAGASVLR
ncbi:unnamed protein product [Nippostrongylus brasiliensis]|uniref:Secreted protein n=1 Tax=Nippostrongylus brasiliensis TaxID=27835 RepID=A0A0N4XM75_NIPBR|nr:unnamed protein product [Nippostrongylus brasiliensis]